MPLPAIAAPIIGALGTIAGNALGNLGARRRQDRANQQNIAFWNMQNKYNDPKAQMERLRKAGLNPNLIYGSSSSGASGQAEKIAPAKAAPYNIDNPLGEINKFADLKQMEAQTNNLQEQNDVLKQETILKAAQTADIGAKTARTKFDLGLASELRNTSLQAAKANLRFMEENTIQKSLDNSVKGEAQKALIKDIFYRAENAKEQLKGNQLLNVLRALEVDLKKIGIERNDPWYFRIIGRHWEQIQQIKLKN